MDLNERLFFYFYGFAHRSSLLDYFLIFLAEYLPYVSLIFLIYVFYKSWKSNKKNFHYFFPFVISASLISWALSFFIKVVFYTPRPFIFFKEITPLFPYFDNGSMVSAHSSLFFTIAFSLYFYKNPFWPLFMIISLLIGIARICVGVHFPLDILAGVLMGFFIPFSLSNCFLFIKNRPNKAKK